MTETIHTKKGDVCMYCALELMRRHGGSFVKKLGEAWWHADATNRHRLVLAFQDYFTDYAEGAVEAKSRCGHAEGAA